MKTKLPILLSTLLLSGLTLPAANIAFVSYHSDDNSPTANAVSAGFTNAPDAGYTALLRANGHNVTRFVTIDNIQNNPDLIAALNTNQLVIISRCVSSGHYQDATETAVWNGLTVPFISLNGYVNRGSRLGFVTADTIPDNNSSQMRLKVNASAHPIFAGVAVDASGLMVNPYSQRVTFTNATTGATTLQVGISVGTSSVISGGTILATVGTSGDAAFGGMVIGEFPAGVASYRGDVFPAKRLVFLTGSRESGITGEGAGILDLLPDGQKLFLNAVTYLTTYNGMPVCTMPLISATNLFPGDAWTFNAGVIGNSPLTYQWYKNGQVLPSATDVTLPLTNMTSADAGAYQLVVTNSLASATSTVATLQFTTLPPPNITNNLISYWPLDAVLGTKTPDLVSGYDMTLNKMGATNIAAGKWGNAFQFDNAAQTFLSRTHNAGEGLPIYQYPNFSVSYWVNGYPQSDHRIFSEGNLTNNNTLFDLGSHNSGSDGTVDLYVRTDGGTVSTDHRHSTATALDGNWHNVVYVQRDIGGGNMTAKLWVDGVLDPVVIVPSRPLSPSTTSIGGLLRASASAWFTGMIDEVAVWNRALSPEEVGILQVTAITNPPSRLQPLAVTRFNADLPAVAAGASTVLRWDVNKDVNQVTITPLGDVTVETSVGSGTHTITPTQTTTYVLTIKRGADTLSATTTVAVVTGVAPGWALLDNFDRYPAGNLFANGYWSDTSGNSAQVVTINGNPAVRTGSGIVYLNLRNLTVTEGLARTLFFRMIAGADNATGATNIVGLTDKSQRNYSDEYSNIGPVLYPTAFTNDVMGITTNGWYLGARNFTGGLIDTPGDALQSGAVYNIWIDITNAPMGEFVSDTFSVYIQKEGDLTRTTLFDSYTSDRDLTAVDPVLGGMLPNLDKLVVMGSSGTYSAVFDDFYLSTTGYNATVPRAYGFTGGPLAPVTIGWQGTQLEIRWTQGTLQQAPSATGPWTDVTGNPASPYLVSPAGTAAFYRTRM